MADRSGSAEYGIAVARVHPDGTVSTSASGPRVPGGDEDDDPLRTSTLTEAASLSKVVAAAVVLDLASRGEVDLDGPLVPTPVAARVDPATYDALTPRLVLSHRTGLPAWAGDPFDTARTDPLVAAPGARGRWAYSGEAYGLLQAHVVAVTSTSWPDLVSATTGLPPDAWDHAHRDRSDDALAHGLGSEGERGVIDVAHPHAAYSLVVSAEDLAGFLRWQLHGDGSSLLGALTTPEVEVGEPGQGLAWGCGWGLVDQPHGRVAWQWGDNDAFCSFAALDAERREAIAVLANAREAATLLPGLCGPVAGDLARAVAWLRS